MAESAQLEGSSCIQIELCHHGIYNKEDTLTLILFSTNPKNSKTQRPP